MKISIISFFLVFLTLSMNAQLVKKNATDTEFAEKESDTIIKDTIHLEEIVIYKGKIDLEARKQFNLLRNRVLVTYPYAKLASERLTSLNAGMASLKTNRDKKKYFKIVENYLSNEFEVQLKKLSRRQGQILIKLIHRQTGITTYDLVKNLKSGWSAFWSSTTAKLFDLRLDMTYQPFEVNEDYLIEAILVQSFETNRLIYQKPVNPANFEKLTEHWLNKSMQK